MESWPDNRKQNEEDKKNKQYKNVVNTQLLPLEEEKRWYEKWKPHDSNLSPGQCVVIRWPYYSIFISHFEWFYFSHIVLR